MRGYDAVIVGGGIVGSSIAFELAQAKLRVMVLDRRQPGMEASWAAAGMLSPSPHSEADAPLVPFAKESLRVYPDFVAGVEESSGKKVEFARPGALETFAGAEAESTRENFLETQRRLGIPAEPLTIEAARCSESLLGPSVRAVARLTEEATVEPRSLLAAVLTGGRNRGAEIRADCAVTSVILDGRRCTGVVAGGEQIIADRVILAAGCFTGLILDGRNCLRGSIPTRAVRGQMVALRQEGVTLRRVLRSSKGYLVPRSDGRIVAGSTLEEAGFEKRVTPEGLRAILDATIELVPALSGAEIVETWSGLRPGTPDGLPILGPTDVEGMFAATGHYRNGILLGPATARATRIWMETGKMAAGLESFSPLRFARAEKFCGVARTAT